MITNLILFLYDIKVEIIRKHGDSYIFFYNNNFYLFKKSSVSEEYLAYIYNYLNNDSLYHGIIKNRHNKYISNYNNNSYVLMVIKFKFNRMLLLTDIINTNKNISYVRKKDFNWQKLWKLKIDQVEYFINNSNIKFDIMTLSIINYYLALSETAICIFNSNNISDYIAISLCHNRISPNSDLYEYYSLTDLIFDNVTRDIGEYLKNYIYSDIIISTDNYNEINLLNETEKYLLISRILFPTYFFDVFDDYVINQRDFSTFYKEFINMETYEFNLKTIINFIIKK